MDEKDIVKPTTEQDKVDVDDLVRKIDEKIAQLIAEERNEHRAKITTETPGLSEEEINRRVDEAIRIEREKEQAEKENTLNMFASLFGGSSRRTSVSYDMSEEQMQSKVWGEMSEGNLSMGDMMLLTDLCNNASPSRVSYLVHLYNDRSQSLEPVEAHFVARYATRRGYTMFTDEDGQTKFEKAQQTEAERLLEEAKAMPTIEDTPATKSLLPSWLRRKK